MIEYRVHLADLNRHHYRVQCVIEDPDPEQRLMLPSWIPGSYLLREFARHVVAIRAESHGREVEIEKVAKGSWLCRAAGTRLTVTIEVFALDVSVRGAYLDGRRAFFNGTCLFLCVEGREQEPVRMLLATPRDARCRDWRAATAMRAERVNEAGFGTYGASNYEELIDHPVEMGKFADIDFLVAGVPHRLVVSGRHRTDLKRVAADLTRLCQAHVELFGPPPPFRAYCFLGTAVGEGYGGLEHCASSSLMFCRDDLPLAGEKDVHRDYQRFLGLCSHEYFHAWNVKRIKPLAFTPFRLDRRNHTRLMWVFEGITSYYQDLMLLRSGLIGAEAYLVRLGQLLTQVYRSPGRFRESLAEASFDAWDKLYKPEANTANATISYYSKGALMALALDLTIRRESDMSLDTVMRELWRRFGAQGRGLEERGFESLSEEVTGVDLADLFQRGVRGTEDLPLAELMTGFGVTMELRQANFGESPGPGFARPGAAVDLGVRHGGHPLGAQLTAVLDAGPAECAGLNPGDILVAIDGLRVSEQGLLRRLSRFRPGDTVRASFFRGDELLECDLTLASDACETCVLGLDPEAGAGALGRRRDWLGH